MDQNDVPPTDDADPLTNIPAAELHALEIEESAAEPPLLPAREPMRTIFRALGLLEQIVGSLLLLLILVLVLAQVAQRFWRGQPVDR